MDSTRKVTICNRQGLHARPCHAIVTIALGFSGELRVRLGKNEVNGKSILELMTLNAYCGTELELRARGEDAEGVLTRLTELISSGFGEDLDR